MMSRSYKKNPAGGMCVADSEKENKRTANRAFRRKSKQAVHTLRLDRIPFSIRQVSDVWCFAKDGKMWFDPQKHPKMLRK
jgi:hypothetical protein